MNPEVSVIIPAYNAEAYIVKAIESALQQTEKNIEVIVVDDGSTDATPDVAREIPDKRLKVIVNQQNLGLSGARNRGIREAKGKWVALLDSDDWYQPERLEKLLQVAYAEDADMIADNMYLIRDGEKFPWSTLLYESGEQIGKIKQIDPVYFVETDIYGQQGLHLGITKPLFKRDFLVQHGIEYDESAKMIQDFWLNMRCLMQGARFIFVSEPYYFYRSHPGSMVTKNKLNFLNETCIATRNFIHQEELVEKHPELARALSKYLAAYERNRVYYSVVEPLKQGKLLKALMEMKNNPYFFVQFITQLPMILNRRIQYYLLGNKLIYDILYQKDKR
jgi:succinoglycan biosynthesis protein ExoO